MTDYLFGFAIKRPTGNTAPALDERQQSATLNTSEVYVNRNAIERVTNALEVRASSLFKACMGGTRWNASYSELFAESLQDEVDGKKKIDPDLFTVLRIEKLPGQDQESISFCFEFIETNKLATTR